MATVEELVKQYETDEALQKEVADRFMAIPKSKEYGYFTLFLQHYFKIERVVNVGNKCFYPSPKVDSMVIKLTPRNIEMDNFKEYNNFIKKAFMHKRKIIYINRSLIWLNII